MDDQAPADLDAPHADDGRPGRSSARGALLWAQRQRWPIPSFIRRWGRALLQRVGDLPAAAADDDWSRPLLLSEEDRPTLDAVIAAGVDSSLPPSGRRVPARPPTTLHVLVATGVLDVGGMDGVVAFLARRLPSTGIEASVVYTDDALPGSGTSGGRLARSLAAEGVPVTRVGPEPVQGWLRGRRADVVSAHGAPDWLISALAGAGIPVVETLHRTLVERELWDAERVRSAQISAFVAVSDLVRSQYLVANPGYPAHRIVTIPNGVDEASVVPRNRRLARAWLGLREEFLFVSLARYALQKNPLGLVAAFSRVACARPGAHLLLAGRADDPALFAQVQRSRAILPGGERIHLRGHCPDPAAVLAAADAFVLDSFFEGWPLASMEALCSGLPVVMSDVGGAWEQVGGPARGSVVRNPLGDPTAASWRAVADASFRPQVNEDELVAAMCEIVDERERWSDGRAALRAESFARFSPEVCLAAHADVLVRSARPVAVDGAR